MLGSFTLKNTVTLSVLFFFNSLLAAPLDHFVTTWETTAVDTVITIPTFAGETYNYAIDWDNDMVPDQTGITGDATHDYGSAGIHTIRIFGTFPRIYINNGSEKDKILSIEQWGTNQWINMAYAFDGATNLINNATDTPDLTLVTLLTSMFSKCSSIGAAIEMSNWDWDTSNIINMHSMFINTSSFNQDISSWSTSNVTNMQNMFANAIAFNQDLSGWNVENVNTTFSFFLNNTAFSTINYDKLLIAWSNQNLLLNDSFQLGSQYCSVDAQNARANIISNFNWTINDGGLCSEALFRTTWKTDNPGTSNDTSITIPTEPTATYAYQVDWNGDGDFDDADEGVIHSGDAAHDYGVIQTSQTINIKGLFPQIYFNNSGDKDKILSIDQWGTNPWTSMSRAFEGASNLINKTSDIPNLSNVTTLGRMFRLASSIGSVLDTGNWDWNTSTIQTFGSMFNDATLFNKDIGNWNIGTTNIASLTSMFKSASSFNQDLSNWTTNNVISMQDIFSQATLFNQDLSSWNIENVTSPFGDFLNDTAFSTNNYDALLVAWNNQNVNSGLIFNVGTTTYCSQAAVDARANLIATDMWTITDGGHTNACDILFENSFEEVIIVKSSKQQMNYDFSEVSLDTLSQEPQLIIKGLDNNDKENMHIHIRNDLGVLQVRVSYLKNKQWIAQQWFDVDNNKTITLQW